MAPSQFIGELRLFPYSRVPSGWAFCNGQTMSINQNMALFSLLGTMYGGDGRTTFGLPDLRGRVALGAGSGYTQGQAGGVETVTLNIAQLPTHIHFANIVNFNADDGPAGNYFAAANAAYQPPPNDTLLSPDTISNTGGNQPHENRQPYLVLAYAIALQGTFPSRN